MADTDIIAIVNSAELEEQRSRVTALQRASQMFEVVIPEDMRRGEEFLRDIKHVAKVVEEYKTTLTRPLMNDLAKVRDLAKPFELSLVEATKLVKAKMLAFTIAQEEVAQLEAAKIETKVEKGLMRADTAANKLAVINDSKPVANTSTTQKLSITDESLIPREFMVVDRVAVTKALWAGVTVPGAELIKVRNIITK